MKITFKNEVPEELLKTAESEHVKYESAHNVVCGYTPFYFTATSDENFCGLISGYTCYAEVYIDDIVVFSEYRNQGIGRGLLKSVEDHFKGGGLNNINLVTNGFQAPKFYEKCGFTLEYVRENKQNPLLSKYFYVKFF